MKDEEEFPETLARILIKLVFSDYFYKTGVLYDFRKCFIHCIFSRKFKNYFWKIKFIYITMAEKGGTVCMQLTCLPKI